MAKEINNLIAKWAEMTPTQWSEHKYGWLLPDGTPVTLTPWQRAVLSEYWERRDLVTTLFISTTKKAGKTLTNSLLTTWRWLTMPGVHFVIGNDSGQSEELQINVIGAMCKRHPVLRRHVKVTKSEVTFLPTGSRIVALPMDYAGAAGSNWLTSSITELWAFAYEHAVRLYEEMTPIPLTPCLRIIDSYAGFSNEGETLKAVWDRGLEGQRVNPQWPIYAVGQQLSYIHTGEEAQQRCWRGSDAARVAYYKEQEATLRPETYRRLHLNEWASSAGAFVPGEWWDRCLDPALPPLGPYAPVVCAVDASVRRDATAMCLISRHPARHRKGHVAVRATRVWYPDKLGRDIDQDATIAATLREWVREYNVVQCCYDKHQLVHLTAQLKEEGLTWFYEFDQNVRRLLADKSLYDRIASRQIAHDGDPELRKHITAAGAKVTGDNRLRIVKPSAKSRVDLAVAVSMGAWESARLNVGDPPSWLRVRRARR